MTRTGTTSSTSPGNTPTAAPRIGGLRLFSVVRAAFSLVWVALVFATSASLVAADRPTAIAAVLLVVYPLWDAAATLVERRIAGHGARNPVGTVNVVLGLAATVAMIVAISMTVGSALLVFGAWALVSGALQLAVAIRRRRTVGAQWPMVVSGGLSVLAGAAIAMMSASAASTLATVAGYSAFGAFWFLVSAIALTIRARRTAA